ncbi:MAG: helix-turn-helix domain-containing protein [Prevotella sp.]
MNIQIEDITIESVKKVTPCSFIDDDLALIDDISTVTMPTKARHMRCFLIAICTQGQLSYTVDTIRQTVNSGSSIIISSGQVIDDYAISADCKGYAVLISEHFVQEVLTGLRDLSMVFLFTRTHPVFALKPSEMQGIHNFYHLLRQKVLEVSRRFRRDTVRLLMQAFIYDAGSIFWDILQTSGEHNTRGEDIFAQFIQLVQRNFRRERRVGWYALQMDISPKYLAETVRLISRKTPNDWINYYVVLEMRVLLKNTTKSIKEITEYMNFPNQSFLGKYFKEHVGISPSEYRKE